MEPIIPYRVQSPQWPCGEDAGLLKKEQLLVVSMNLILCMAMTYLIQIVHVKPYLYRGMTLACVFKLRTDP